jgi:hypothetical protein
MYREEILKAAYEATSDAFLEIANQNVAVVRSGGLPTVEDLQREDDAQNDVTIARHAYFSWLRSGNERKGPP